MSIQCVISPVASTLDPSVVHTGYWIGNVDYSCEVTACFICIRSIISRMPTELLNHPHSTKKWSFTFRILQQVWLNPQETADLVTLTGEIFNGKLHFCAVPGTCYAFTKP